MNNLIRVHKILPTGRYVERYLTPREFWNGTWWDQGWTSDELTDNTLRYEQQCNKVFKQTFEKMSLKHLRLYSQKCTMRKHLPNGTWKKLKGHVGEYYLNGWSNNGWILGDVGWVDWIDFKRAYAGQAREKAKQLLREQNWWKPKRSLAFALQLAPSGGLEGISQTEAQMLTNPEWEPNPKWDKYWEKVVAFARRENKDYDDYLIQLGRRNHKDYDKLRTEFYKTAMKIFNRIHKTKTPPRLVRAEDLKKITRVHRQAIRRFSFFE